MQRSARELATMGHFDAEKVNPDVRPNYEDGTVDINWNLEQKSNDQIEFSLGWGQTGVIGKIGLKLNNFSMRNLFRKNSERRGVLPVGDVKTKNVAVFYPLEMAKHWPWALKLMVSIINRITPATQQRG